VGRSGPSHAYPNQLAAFALSRLDELGLPRPSILRSPGVLPSVLSVAYQASLLRDEDRPLSFRIVLAEPEAFPDDGGPPSGGHRLLLTPMRPFEVHELRKLAPAVKFQRALVGVSVRGARLGIWGIVHTGPRWLHFAQGGRGVAPELPQEVVVHVNGPGDVVVSLGSQILARLHAGELTTPLLDVFDAAWLPGLFAPIRREIMELHEAARARAAEPWSDVDYGVISRVGQNLVRRVVATIRGARHGGSLLFVPPSRADELTGRDLVDLKYRFDDAEPRRRFRSLILDILRELARLGAQQGVAVADFSLYESTENTAIAALDEAVFELAHLMAALADVDGLVVMTQRFELIGFGGIVSGHLPELVRVAQALDVDGTSRVEESVDAVGTRHRSAYRICAELPDALAVVVSQDGSVRFVRSVAGVVTYWDQVAASAFGG
jgi:hypothetical protein